MYTPNTYGSVTKMPCWVIGGGGESYMKEEVSEPKGGKHRLCAATCLSHMGEIQGPKMVYRPLYRVCFMHCGSDPGLLHKTGKECVILCRPNEYNMRISHFAPIKRYHLASSMWWNYSIVTNLAGVANIDVCDYRLSGSHTPQNPEHVYIW